MDVFTLRPEVTIEAMPGDIPEALESEWNIGIRSLLIKIQETSNSFSLKSTIHVDLSNLRRFSNLRDLWIVGFNRQRYEFVVNNATSPVIHLHIYASFRAYQGYEKQLQVLLNTFPNVRTLDLRNVLSADLPLLFSF